MFSTVLPRDIYIETSLYVDRDIQSKHPHPANPVTYTPKCYNYPYILTKEFSNFVNFGGCHPTLSVKDV